VSEGRFHRTSRSFAIPDRSRLSIELIVSAAPIVWKAYVTKRMKPMTVDGKPTHVIGLPLHWGFTGQTRRK
jgi:hypothetical protein